ncbi:MAG: DNA polymerase III subunit delta' [Acidobacteria bacterium]|nr:MAG: DNA polymerase III subunit delta' [Acidobacteriota bacterium]
MLLKNLVGNEKLLGLLARNPLPPASIFEGPDGIGKRAAALALAGLTNCRQPAGHELCGSCSSCQKLEAGNHPDIRLFVPEKNVLKIDMMRELSREAYFRPFEGKARFFIVDQAEKMTEEAANSLLKTLEEPPPTSHLVLVTAFPHRLLSTIRSRCQKFTFRPLTRAEIAAYLKAAGRPEDSELRAAFADGSIGKALSLNLEELIRDRDIVLEVFSGWTATRSFEEVFKRAEAPPLKADLKNRDRTKDLLELLHTLAEDLYFIQMGTPERLINLDRRSELEKLSRQLTLDGIGNLLYHIAQSYWDVDHYVSPLMSFETLWLRAEQGKQYGRDTHSQAR